MQLKNKINPTFVGFLFLYIRKLYICFQIAYISKNKEAFSGLIFLGAYSTIDLSDTSFNIISIYGENDNVMNKDKYNSSLSNLPTNYHEEIITGRNHAYFGMYGNQAGDGKAIISNEEQIEQAADIIYKFLQ